MNAARYVACPPVEQTVERMAEVNPLAHVVADEAGELHGGVARFSGR